MTTKPTKEERRAIAALKRLAKKWPDSLWLFSASGKLCVMQKKDDEIAMRRNGCVDQDYLVGQIEIENDGGDW